MNNLEDFINDTILFALRVLNIQSLSHNQDWEALTRTEIHTGVLCKFWIPSDPSRNKKEQHRTYSKQVLSIKA
jgi:hypothetical protein